MNERRKNMMIMAAREFYQRARWKGSKVGDVYREIQDYLKKEMK